MSYERRLQNLETVWQRSAPGPTPEEWREVRAAVERVAAERGLDADEVLAETERMIASGGWNPKEASR